MNPADISKLISSNIGSNNGLQESLGPHPKFSQKSKDMSERVGVIKGLLENISKYNLPGDARRDIDAAMSEISKMQSDVEYEEYKTRCAM
jgi:hypothetical protein